MLNSKNATCIAQHKNYAGDAAAKESLKDILVVHFQKLSTHQLKVHKKELL